MTVFVQTIYPQTNSFSGIAQLNEGPFNIPFVHKLLRVEVHAKINFFGIGSNITGVEANWQLWGLQWVVAGAPANDVVATPDGPQWIMRRQVGSDEGRLMWSPSTADVGYQVSYPLTGEWAGQLAINTGIDFYLSLRSPIGASVPNQNLYGSMRWWYT